MFQGRHFYHETIKRAIIAFGKVFNDITIQRNDGKGKVLQSIPVPLAYGPKNKFLQRAKEATDLEKGRSPVKITLPRMAFEITNLTYDPARKLPQTQPLIAQTNGAFRRTYTSTPYDMDITLSVMTKNQEDALQIVEQIFPYFSPDFSVTVLELPELGIKRDIQIILNNVSNYQDYDSEFDKDIVFLWEFQFTMKINFYGFVSNAEVIRKVIQNVYATNTLGKKEDGTRITTEPDPLDADPASDYGFTTTFEELYGE